MTSLNSYLLQSLLTIMFQVLLLVFLHSSLIMLWSKAQSVIAQGCGQTLGLGLGQSKDIVVVIISLQQT